MQLASVSIASTATRIRASSQAGASSRATAASADASAGTGVSAGASGTPASTAEEFRDFLKLSPVDRMRAGILSRMKMTEADLAKLDPSERQRIEDQIKAQIREAFGGKTDQIKTGQFADFRA